MATTFYLLNQAAPYTPATIRGAFDDVAGAVTKALSTSKTGGGVIASVARAEINASSTFDVLLYRGVSGPLAAQTISGTLDVVLGILESSASADFCFHIHAYVTQGDSDTPRGTILSDYVETTANEWPTTATGKGLASAQTLSSLAITAGDRLVVEIGLIARNSVATSFTGTLRYGTQNPTTLTVADDLTAGSTSVTTLAGSIVFSAAIAESVVGLRASMLQVVEANASGAQRASHIAVVEASGGAEAHRTSTLQVVVAVPTGSSPQRASQVAIAVAIDTGASLDVSWVGVVVARAPKIATLKIKGRYSGGSGYRASTGEGVLTVKR